MAKCQVCGAKINIARWAEIVRDKTSDKVACVTMFVPYRENDDTFDLDPVEKRYPEPRYDLYSFHPEAFKGEKIHDHGAFCIKCNASL